VTLIERQEAYKARRVRLGLDRPPNNILKFTAPVKEQRPEPVKVPIKDDSEEIITELRREVISLRVEISTLRETICRLRDAADSSPYALYGSVKGIAQTVARYYGIPFEDIVSKARTAEMIRPRHVAMYLSRELTPRSFSDIGKVLNKDHSCVMHGVSKLKSQLATDPCLVNQVAAITSIIEAQRHV
jgi:hypothetical protein